MSKLLINDKPVMVLPKLAVAIGLNEAIVLQQIHYWLITYKNANSMGHYHQGRWWVYNTKQEWKSNFPWWSENTVWRALTSLRNREIVMTSSAFNKKKYDKTLWYTIDYDKLNELELTQNDNSLYPEWEQHIPNMGTTIPETTSETTNKEGKILPPMGLYENCLAIHKAKKGKSVVNKDAYSRMISKFEAIGVTEADYSAAIDAMDADPRYTGTQPTSYESWAINIAKDRRNPPKTGKTKRSMDDVFEKAKAIARELDKQNEIGL